MSTAGLVTSPAPSDPRKRLQPHLMALCNVLIGPVALSLLALMMWGVLKGPAPAFDLRYAYTSAGHRVLDGVSPYAWTPEQFRAGLAFVYPALSALMFAPIALIPRALAAVVFTPVCVAMVPATLWLLGVRDWRPYGITLLWMPVYSGWMTVNESLFLMFGLACLWHRRDHPLVAGFLVAAMISLKPLMWPLALWLLATRRWRASAYSLIFGLALNLVAWSVIGFGQVGRYLHAAGLDTSDSWRTGFGVPALLGHFGVGRGVGIAVMLLVSLVLVAAVVYSGFFRRDPVQALILTITLALVSSPLLWGHYLVLLIVPLALRRPQLGWIWAVPVFMWFQQPAAPVHTWQELGVWAMSTAMFILLIRRGRGGAELEPAT